MKTAPNVHLFEDDAYELTASNHHRWSRAICRSVKMSRQHHGSIRARSFDRNDGFSIKYISMQRTAIRTSAAALSVLAAKSTERQTIRTGSTQKILSGGHVLPDRLIVSPIMTYWLLTAASRIRLPRSSFITRTLMSVRISVLRMPLTPSTKDGPSTRSTTSLSTFAAPSQSARNYFGFLTAAFIVCGLKRSSRQQRRLDRRHSNDHCSNSETTC